MGSRQTPHFFKVYLPRARRYVTRKHVHHVHFTPSARRINYRRRRESLPPIPIHCKSQLRRVSGDDARGAVMADIDLQKLPRHIAIIMDGNGRWAKQHALGRIMGHQKGVEAVRKTVRLCREIGIQYLTLYAFSVENWLRPDQEVAALMQILRQYLRSELAEMKLSGRSGGSPMTFGRESWPPKTSPGNPSLPIYIPPASPIPICLSGPAASFGSPIFSSGSRLIRSSILPESSGRISTRRISSRPLRIISAGRGDTA